jgi:hypothetical protein
MWPRCHDRRAFMNAIKLRVKYDSDPAAVTPEVQAALDKYVFYHNIELAPGIRTRGIPWTDLYVPPYLDVCRKFDFSGKRVLDGGAAMERHRLSRKSSARRKFILWTTPILPDW